MKMLWCWRCKAQVPMLDDEEYKRVSSLFGTGPEDGNPIQRRFAPAFREFERITGHHETQIHVLYGHILSKYGPPCAKCGRPLRTPRAKLCGSCMHPRTT